ncbi:MAG: ATPase, T2SS/T4P/T4SS family [Candidatus Caenarcaniphilales bacterium]|nr:ATPase, T2SS/T4P/T4SS family [Candidatus Caenarcaniphilales bacterium]
MSKNLSPIDAEFASIFFKPIAHYLENPETAEVMVNAHDDIWVEDDKGLWKAPEKFSPDALVSAVNSLAQYVGRPLMENVFSVDARMPDGSRVCIVLPPISGKDPIFAIRKFKEVVSDLEFMVKKRTLTEEMVYLIDSCVKIKKNIMVSGGTSSGKTTLLNLIAAKIPDNERILTIEDSRELQLKQEHVLSLEARPADKHGKGEFSIRQCLKSTLRLRPDRIIVGEIRSGEAFDLVQAMNTGHGGCMGTVHANAPTDTLRRIESLALMADVDMPLIALRSMIASALDLIICPARLSDGSRRIVQIAEIGPLTEKGDYQTFDICKFVSTKRDKNTGKIDGYFEFTGHVPAFFDMFEAEGVDVPIEFFRKRVSGSVPPEAVPKLLERGYEVPGYALPESKVTNIPFEQKPSEPIQQQVQQQSAHQPVQANVQAPVEPIQESVPASEPIKDKIQSAIASLPFMAAFQPKEEVKQEQVLPVHQEQTGVSAFKEESEQPVLNQITPDTFPGSFPPLQESTSFEEFEAPLQPGVSEQPFVQPVAEDFVNNPSPEAFVEESVNQPETGFPQSQHFEEPVPQASEDLPHFNPNAFSNQPALPQQVVEEKAHKPSILERLSKLGGNLGSNTESLPETQYAEQVSEQPFGQGFPQNESAHSEPVHSEHLDDHFEVQEVPQGNEFASNLNQEQSFTNEDYSPTAIVQDDFQMPAQNYSQPESVQPQQHSGFDDYAPSPIDFEEDTVINPGGNQAGQSFSPQASQAFASEQSSFDEVPPHPQEFPQFNAPPQQSIPSVESQQPHTDSQAGGENKQHAVIAEILRRMRENKTGEG